MDLLHQLIKSQPFIYLIGENYYLISNAIFQECSGEDITFAKKFVDEVNGVISLHNHRILQQRDVEDFNRLYDEIKKNADPRKWICVEAEHTYVLSKGDLVVLIMSNELAPKIKENFENLK